ncbi:trypsin-like peptidase [Kribbella rubisoli]|uniref:Trypsin-like peptidase n=1 Tax=Kribbella rubisoli TaxID=3075929 RepID=A0A4Q7W2G9_9ACTN|nr:serine protease [Kribbella rubisoli]RZU03424.1 trypsin-like peptidase [Kribbella rubisoli]
MEDGRNGLPRPPRRIPANAGSLTQLEVPSRLTAPPPTPPARRPWIFGRILAGFVVLLVITAGGAGAGWFVHQQRLDINTDEVLKAAGPAVVRVLATTCGSTGEASGVLIDNGRVLTAASAVANPRSIVIITQDGRIRRANLLGTSADGVAVLQSIGQPGAPIQVAAADPDPKAQRALIGYTAAGKQTINEVGSTADPRALSEVMNTAKLGGPVVDRSGGLIGLVTGATVQAGAIVPLENLRGYAAVAPSGVTVATAGTCDQSRGPQAAVVPALQVAGTTLNVEVQHLFGNYITLENQQDFRGLQSLYSARFAQGMTEARDLHNHRTSYFFNAKITDVAPDGSYARMSYDILFAPTATGAGGQNCNRLDVRFQLVRVGGKLLIDRTVPMATAVSCDSD